MYQEALELKRDKLRLQIRRKHNTEQRRLNRLKHGLGSNKPVNMVSLTSIQQSIREQNRNPFDMRRCFAILDELRQLQRNITGQSSVVLQYFKKLYGYYQQQRNEQQQIVPEAYYEMISKIGTLVEQYIGGLENLEINEKLWEILSYPEFLYVWPTVASIGSKTEKNSSAQNFIEIVSSNFDIYLKHIYPKIIEVVSVFGCEVPQVSVEFVDGLLNILQKIMTQKLEYPADGPIILEAVRCLTGIGWNDANMQILSTKQNLMHQTLHLLKSAEDPEIKKEGALFISCFFKHSDRVATALSAIYTQCYPLLWKYLRDPAPKVLQATMFALSNMAACGEDVTHILFKSSHLISTVLDIFRKADRAIKDECSFFARNLICRSRLCQRLLAFEFNILEIPCYFLKDVQSMPDELHRSLRIIFDILIAAAKSQDKYFDQVCLSLDQINIRNLLASLFNHNSPVVSKLAQDVLEKIQQSKIFEEKGMEQEV